MHTDGKNIVKRVNFAEESFTEAVNAEKQLWELIHTKGPLNTDVQELFHKTRSSYENVILGEYELAELRDFEYALWRLHYKQIDEYRTKIESAGRYCVDPKTPQDLRVVQHDVDTFRKGFRSFLLEANEFYCSLITKIKDKYGLSQEFCKEFIFSNSYIWPTKMHKGQFLWHRCLVCLGDLARYNALYTSFGINDYNWSAASLHYLDASVIWPDSGNPHNQLAVLAIYAGDELLALYHCIRSLAVCEPFFNAQDNLMLLFEKNRSSHLQALSGDVNFNFYKPSERAVIPVAASDSHIKSITEEATEYTQLSDGSCLWRLIVRMISIFYIKSSLEDFSCTFASTLRELEVLLSLNDVKLKTVLESYRHMRDDQAISSPLRFLQVICILIFSITFLYENQKQEIVKQEGSDCLVSQELALAATFIFVGRLVHRCLVANSTCHNILLPAIKVFAQWLACSSDIIVRDAADEKYGCALDYFMSSFVDLLNKFSAMEKTCTESANYLALWEDHELRGFTPLASVYEQLNFVHNETGRAHEERDEHSIRIHHIQVAAIKLANMPRGSQKWIDYDGTKKKFHIIDPVKVGLGMSKAKDNNGSCVEGDELNDIKNASATGIPNGHEKLIHDEEDEVIVFKPIARSDSGSVYATIDASVGVSTNRPHDQLVACSEQTHVSKENQISSKSQPMSAKAPTSDSGISFQFSVQTTQGSGLRISEDGSSVLAGAPSLNTWGSPKECSSAADNQGREDSSKKSGFGIDDVSPAFIKRLQISGVTEAKKDAEMTHFMPSDEHSSLLKGNLTSTGPEYTSATPIYVPQPYHVGPPPSAPLLPDYEDVLYTGNSSLPFTKHEDPSLLSNNGTVPGPNFYQDWKGVSNFVNASSRPTDYLRWTTMQGPPNYNPLYPGYNVFNLLSSPGIECSTWPHRYWNYINQDPGPFFGSNDRFFTPTSLGSFQDIDNLRLATHDRWVPPVNHAYGADDNKRERLYPGNHQRSIPLGAYGGMTEERADHNILLQYLKDREWRLQQQQQQQQQPPSQWGHH